MENSTAFVYIAIFASDFRAACEDNLSWRDSKNPAKGCSAWKGYNCADLFDGYDLPAIVMENCKQTCGLCCTLHTGPVDWGLFFARDHTSSRSTSTLSFVHIPVHMHGRQV